MGFIDWTRRVFGGSVEKSSIDDWFRQFGLTNSAAGVAVTQSTAVSISTVYACTSIRSKDVARCTPRLMRVNSARSETPILDHPIARIFKRPNDWQTWTEFCRQMHSAYLLRGNAFAVIIRDGRGNPVALIPINPDLVILYEAADGSIFYQVSRVGVFMAAILRGQPLMIPEDDVFHLRDLGFNILLGLSRIAIARDSFGLAMGLEQQASRFMDNGARPSGVLQTEKKLSDEAAARLRAQWEQLRTGIKNVGRTAILEDGLKWSPMQLSSVDLEFIAQREFSIADVARWFDMPLYKLAVKGEMSRLKPDDADQQYVNTTIMPDLDAWEEKFEQKFSLDADGFIADFDERRLLRAAEATRINNQRLKIMSGISTQNECRAENGDPPLPGGDVLLTPVNLAASGSDMTGTAPDGAGRPDDGTLPDPGAANDGKPNDGKGFDDEGAGEDDGERHERHHQEFIEAVRSMQAPVVNFTAPPVHVTAPPVHIEQAAAAPINVTIPITMPRKGVERTIVTKHDPEGRILELEKTEIDDEDELK